MSYTTVDRYGAITNTYAHARGGAASQCPGCAWWPDFGPGTKDFSAQPRSHPSEAIFERVVEPGKWSTAAKPSPPAGPPTASQFRNPEPARDAMLNKAPTRESKLVAHAVTERQAALRRMEMRQRRVDSWLAQAPVRMAAAALPGGPPHSQSEPSLPDVSSSMASQVSRDVYRRHGFLVDRSRGNIADGVNGAQPRRHNPLSFSAILFGGDVAGSAGNKTRRAYRPRKPTQQWRLCPESRFVFDPETCLPVPRGGRNSLPPKKWPELEAAGNRDFAPGQDNFTRTTVPSLATSNHAS